MTIKRNDTVLSDLTEELLIQRNPVTLTWYYSQNDINKVSHRCSLFANRRTDIGGTWFNSKGSTLAILRAQYSVINVYTRLCSFLAVVQK